MDNKIITTDKLQEKLNKREPVFILDVRPLDQRNEWRIAESHHVDVYTQLNAGNENVFDGVEIPTDTTVITVCAAGRTSLKAAEALHKRGVKAYSLEGGMKAWNYAWNSAQFTLSNGVKVIQVRRAAKGILSYVVGSSTEAIVIDASLDPGVYLNIAAENGWRVKGVIDTHIHADFISRSKNLAKSSGARHFMMDQAKVSFEYTPISSGSSVAFGHSALEFLYTPGHTWESASLKISELAIFTGDTLFIDSIGRPDLKAAQDEAREKAKYLFRSLKKLLSLNSDMLVMPAHTSQAVPFDGRMIADKLAKVREKVDLSRLTESAFVNSVLERIPATPPNYEIIAELNRQGSFEGHSLAELEAGGNHCAIAP